MTQPAHHHPAEVVARALAAFAEEPGALLEILHAVQGELGFVPEEVLPQIAKARKLSLADVHGVVTYYHDFRTQAPARRILKVCRAEACQAVGCRGLEAHAQACAARDPDLAVEPVYCLGNCALGPSVQLNGELHGCVTVQRLDELLAAARDKGAS